MPKKPKKLKKIPSDIISYVTIEGAAIKDKNDKMIIVSYAQSKVDIIDYYIALIDAQTKNYIVPHSREYLVDYKERLQAAIKEIMDKPIPLPPDSYGFQYPKGYEG